MGARASPRGSASGPGSSSLRAPEISPQARHWHAAGSTSPTFSTRRTPPRCRPSWWARRHVRTCRGSGSRSFSHAFSDVCGRRRVPYVDTYSPLVDHEQWASDLAAGDGVHPGQAGYGLLAWLVLHHDWYDWLGIPAPA
ncbi:GDSL-type esterase/lipase family protein [Salana multivorans]